MGNVASYKEQDLGIEYRLTPMAGIKRHEHVCRKRR